MVTDLDFADGTSFLSDTVEQACTLILVVEKECKNIGLRLNAKKTKVIQSTPRLTRLKLVP